MKQLFTFLLCYSTAFLCLSQSFEPPEMRFKKGLEENFNEDFGELTDDQDAIYIFDTKDYYYGISAEVLSLYEDRHVRMKILDTDALDLGDVSFKYISEDNYQSIGNIKASCYTMENGELVEHKLKKKDIFRTKLDDRISEVTFAIPNVKEGSIIEYEYQIISKRKWRPDTWYFSKNYPVAYSQVTFTIPEWFEFSRYARGYQGLVLDDTELTMTQLGAGYQAQPSVKYIWGKENLKAFKDEDYTANSDDFKEQIQFRLNSYSFPGESKTFNTTWQNLNKNLLEDDYADQQKDKKVIVDLVSTVTAGITDQKEIIRAIFDYVNENVEIEKQGWVYTSKPVKKVLNDKTGNIADANLLLVNMLQSAGIEAYPMLISTRSDGYIDQTYPTMQAFTYPVAYINIDDEHLILNATSDYRPYYLPSSEDFNLSGWVVRKENYGWVEIEDLAPKSMRFYKIDGILSEDGTYSGTVKVESNNYLSVSDRANINEDSVEERFQKLYSGENDIIISETNHSDLEDDYENFSFSAEFEIDDHAQSINNFIYFSPIIFEAENENPFTLEDRKYPVDFPYPRTNIQSITITLPDGYRLEEIPQPVIVNFSNIASISINVTEINNAVQIQLKEMLKETVIEPKDYRDLQKYIDKVIQETSKQLTLVKSE